MPRPEVVLSPVGRQDIKRIRRHLIDRNEGPSADIDRYCTRLYQQIMRLSVAAAAHPVRADLGPDLRIVTFERSATIVYRIEPGLVRVLRVFGRGRDFAKALMDNDRSS